MLQGTQELVKRIEKLTLDERRNQGQWFSCMVEIEDKGIHLELGYSSLFSYMTEGLKYSESSAGKRLQVVKACRRYPKLIGLISDNQLSLSAISLLSRHLGESHAEVLIEKAIGLSTREIERLIVSFAPKPIPEEIERKLPSKDSGKDSGKDPAPLPLLDNAPAEKPKAIPPPPNKVKPLTAEITRYGFNGNKAFEEKLKRCRAILKHKHPAGRLEDVLECALDALLEKNEKKLAQTNRKVKLPAKHTHYAPVHLKREVWRRDTGQCTFVSETGRRCTERGGLEIDHAQAWAQGGSSWDVGNLRLRCRAHNQFSARKVFGPYARPAGKARVSVAERASFI